MVRIKILGYIFTVIIILFIGYVIGRMPTPLEQNQNATKLQYYNDSKQIGADAQTMFSLCEQKYQAIANGDNATGYRLMGQIDVLINDINNITNKYKTSAL